MSKDIKFNVRLMVDGKARASMAISCKGQGASSSHVYWLHFAARPMGSRRRINFILK